jgi:hypothetical protein
MNVLNMFRPTPRDDLAAQRQRRAAALARTCLLELDRDRLTFGRFGTVEHDGTTYAICRGIVDDPKHSPAAAFYVNPATGGVVYLEPIR